MVFLGLFGPPDVDKLFMTRNIDGLIKALGNKEYSGVRYKAALMLGMIGDPRGVEPLRTALNDPENRVRLAAASVLITIGDSRAVDILHALLEDKDWNIRDEAAKVLMVNGDSLGKEALNSPQRKIGRG